MAYAVDFKGSNVVYRAPPGRDDVNDLHVMRNRGMLVSCWALDPAELEEIIRTGRIYLSIDGHGMPPVFVGSESAVRDLTAEMGPLPRQND